MLLNSRVNKSETAPRLYFSLKASSKDEKTLNSTTEKLLQHEKNSTISFGIISVKVG